MGFGSSFPLIVAHASAHAALNGAGNLCTFRRAKLLVSVRMRCKVIAPFCGGDAGLFARQPLFGNLQWCLRDFWFGILASLPLLVLFLWLLHSSLPPFERIGEFLEAYVRTVFEPWAIWQLAVISPLAGVCEEAFFRSVFQGGLARHIGTIPASWWPASSLAAFIW